MPSVLGSLGVEAGVENVGRMASCALHMGSQLFHYKESTFSPFSFKACPSEVHLGRLRFSVLFLVRLQIFLISKHQTCVGFPSDLLEPDH